jgi:hypothetical protein
MFMADKKMEEVRVMSNNKVNGQIIIGTTIEATNQLKLAGEELMKNQLDETSKETIQFQINQAKYVYKEIIKSLEIKEEEKIYLELEVEKIL